MRRKVIFILAGLGVVLILIGGYFLLRTNPVEDLSLTISISEKNVMIGVPFEIKVKVANNSNNVLEDTLLTVSLPDDVVFVSPVPNKTIENKTIGSLGEGSVNEESFSAVVTGGENTIKRIRAAVSFLPSSLGSRFEQGAEADFNITESGISLDISSPQKVFSGEEVELKIKYKNVSRLEFANLRLTIDWPQSFQFISATLDPETAKKNSWDLGNLRPNSEGELTIKGKLFGPDNAFFDLKASVTAEFFGGTYTVAEKSASINISPSPLALFVAVNESQDYIAKPKDRLQYKITYTNNTEVALKDVIITAKLIGEMFDLSTISSNGFLKSTDNAIVWNASRDSQLVNIAPGGSGQVEFSINVKPDYPISRLADRNFTLKVLAEIESPTVPYNVSADQTLGQAELITKVAGNLKLSAFGLFRDAASGLVNSGPMPPKVGQTTQFTIHWQIKNTSTDMTDISLKAFLGPNVTFTGTAKSNISSVPSYNSRTQEVIWNIDKILATQGTLTEPIEAIFQVALTPSAEQKGEFVTLVSQASLSATDSFTASEFTAKVEPVTTQLPNDPTVGGKGVVE